MNSDKDGDFMQFEIVKQPNSPSVLKRRNQLPEPRHVGNKVTAVEEQQPIQP